MDGGQKVAEKNVVQRKKKLKNKKTTLTKVKRN